MAGDNPGLETQLMALNLPGELVPAATAVSWELPMAAYIVQIKSPSP